MRVESRTVLKFRKISINRVRKKKFILSFRVKRGMTKSVGPFFRNLLNKGDFARGASLAGAIPGEQKKRKLSESRKRIRLAEHRV